MSEEAANSYANELDSTSKSLEDRRFEKMRELLLEWVVLWRSGMRYDQESMNRLYADSCGIVSADWQKHL